ncbi:MAG: 1,4-alpha-glucan branching protein domain-containing protein [Acidobacteriaceae bacterium]
MKEGQPQGYIALTLHAHLPWVVHHGTWPHGLEWLLEAAAETYLPLLRVLRNLERDGLTLRASINLSPVLLEQLAHPTFRAEFPEYLRRKIQAAQEDEFYFWQSGDEHYAKTARMWRALFEQTLEDFEALGGDIIAGFRRFSDAGLIEVITCCATHGYLPLLGTDASVTAQIKTGVAAHARHLGRHPRGIWIPECGYRPAGAWLCPVPPHGSSEPWPTRQRIGIDEAVAAAGLDYCFVDSHLVEQSMLFTPYQTPDEKRPGGGAAGTPAALPRSADTARSLYRTYFVDGPSAPGRPVTIFPRDSRTGIQVWSSATGYPGDPHYLDFHKKRWPGGHRYWQVTDDQADASMKTAYCPDRAMGRVRAHAEHFVSVVYDALRDSLNCGRPPVLSALFDAELFGHWWFEGPAWLEQIARIIAKDEFPIALTTASEYLDAQPAEGSLAIPEGSWGKNGNNEVWLNPHTAWTWSHIYAAEARVQQVATEAKRRCGQAAWAEERCAAPLGCRIAKQMCRELLLLESSDWQFLITTEAARNYAEDRFLTHLDQFREVDCAWQEFLATGSLTPDREQRLSVIEQRDPLFADIDPNSGPAQISGFGRHRFRC